LKHVRDDAERGIVDGAIFPSLKSDRPLKGKSLLAYFAPSRSVVSRHRDHLFRAIVITRFAASRSPVSRHRDHPFRAIVIAVFAKHEQSILAR